MSVNPIDVKALKDGEYYWLYAPAIMCDEDPFLIARFRSAATQGWTIDRWSMSGTLYDAGPGITPISHIKKPKWEPK